MINKMRKWLKKLKGIKEIMFREVKKEGWRRKIMRMEGGK